MCGAGALARLIVDANVERHGRGRPRQSEIKWRIERSWHLHSRRGARIVRRISRRKVWRLAADRAVRAACHHAAGRASSATTLAMDAAGGSFRAPGSIRWPIRADREALPRANLRIVPWLSDRNRRRIRRSDSAQRIGGIVEVRRAAVSYPAVSFRCSSASWRNALRQRCTSVLRRQRYR